MRSKEVEKAINDLMFIVVKDIYCNEIRIDKTKIIKEYNESVGTVLDYIKELETKNAMQEYRINEMDIPKQVIRDKIEILEKLQNEFKENEELRIKIIAYKELLESEN